MQFQWKLSWNGLIKSGFYIKIEGLMQAGCGGGRGEGRSVKGLCTCSVSSRRDVTRPQPWAQIRHGSFRHRSDRTLLFLSNIKRGDVVLKVGGWTTLFFLVLFLIRKKNIVATHFQNWLALLRHGQYQNYSADLKKLVVALLVWCMFLSKKELFPLYKIAFFFRKNAFSFRKLIL